MEAKVPMPGPGRFQWNSGGWFGSQVGSTAWMLVGAVMFAIKAPWIAAAFSLCFAVANVVGTALWSRRDRLRPYAAMQLLILVIGVSGMVAIASVDMLRPAGAPPDATWDEIRGGRLPLLAIVAGLMASFAFMEWDTKKAK
jgi:hypothetical protein